MPNEAKTIYEEGILKALLYSEIFNYPLSSDEIFLRMETNHVTRVEISRHLEQLQQKGLVHQRNNVFALRNSDLIFSNRAKGNLIALQMMPKAIRRARLIYQFPFVRGVMISGSLSKNYADEKSDVDFFIVTQTGRLWIARTLLVLFQKIALLNSRKFFCLNYFVTESSLNIKEQNIFTATELATLIPVCGLSSYQKLVKENTWLSDYLPNFKLQDQISPEPKSNAPKKIMEYILYAKFFDFLEKRFLKATSNHWKKLYQQKYSSVQFETAFKATPAVAKSHPDFHQKRVIEAYQEKVNNFFVAVNHHSHG